MNIEKLSLEKLWELFPITFTDYSKNFKTAYLQEEKNLKSLIGNL